MSGHVLECGTQATGGNFSGFVPEDRPLGFPVAELHADGSCAVTKHAGTGGRVTADTVTAQLVYEIGSPTYLNPDVSAHLDTLSLTTDGPDRVRISVVRGSPPPATLKVCVNELGGWRNSAELVLVGLDIEAKAAWVRDQVTRALRSSAPAHVEWSLVRTDRDDADTEEGASCRLRATVRDPDADRVGKAFTAPLVELALASYPGFTLTGPPARPTPYGVFRAAYVDRAEVHEQVVLDGTRLTPLTASTSSLSPTPPSAAAAVRVQPGPGHGVAGPRHRTRRLPLGRILHARSGDKGGDANVGVWAMDAASRPDRVQWLLGFLTAERVQALLPETAPLEVEVHALPNLGAVNVVVRGLLGEGVAASTRFDRQAKALGEWLRSRHADVPEALL